MEQAPVTTNRRLQRGDGPLAGVAAGMADYFDIDPVIIRLGLVATTVLGGPTVPIVYLAAWLIIPAADAGSQAPVEPAAPWASAPPPAPSGPVTPAPSGPVTQAEPVTPAPVPAGPATDTVTTPVAEAVTVPAPSDTLLDDTSTTPVDPDTAVTAGDVTSHHRER